MILELIDADFAAAKAWEDSGATGLCNNCLFAQAFRRVFGLTYVHVFPYPDHPRHVGYAQVGKTRFDLSKVLCRAATNWDHNKVVKQSRFEVKVPDYFDFEINVSLEDIAEGCRRSFKNCPHARAIQRHFTWKVECGRTGVNLHRNGGFFTPILPHEASEWIGQYDAIGSASPITYTLTVSTKCLSSLWSS